MPVTEPPASEEQLTDGMVRRRTASSVIFVGSLGMVNLALGFLGNIVLARLITRAGCEVAGRS